MKIISLGCVKYNEKSVFNNQYAIKDYANNKLSSDERTIEARLQNITTSWTDLPKRAIVIFSNIINDIKIKIC